MALCEVTIHTGVGCPGDVAMLCYSHSRKFDKLIVQMIGLLWGSWAHYGRCSPAWPGSRYLFMSLQVSWSRLHCCEETPRPGHPYARQSLTQLGREHGGTQAETGEVTESCILICRRAGVGERGTETLDLAMLLRPQTHPQ